MTINRKIRCVPVRKAEEVCIVLACYTCGAIHATHIFFLHILSFVVYSPVQSFPGRTITRTTSFSHGTCLFVVEAIDKSRYLGRINHQVDTVSRPDTAMGDVFINSHHTLHHRPLKVTGKALTARKCH